MRAALFFLQLISFGLMLPGVWAQQEPVVPTPLDSSRPRQRVALVLSGGAARGLAHIGVLKALEEHRIPIDCISGTSMGALVGAFYAAGYSPAEIEQIAYIASRDWLAPGLVLNESYFFSREQADATFASVPLSLRDSDRLLPEYLVADYAVNYGLNEYLVIASNRAKGNFDSLFVPFRATASDIFEQKSILLKAGSLPFAVRASTAVPIFFLPASNDRVEDLFDGGIYNNFPVDVATSEFVPDHVIGVYVGSPPVRRDRFQLQRAFLEKLISQSTDSKSWQKMPVYGSYIEPDLNEMGGADFTEEKVRYAIQQGYAATIACIEDIKRAVGYRQQDPAELAARRKAFRAALSDTFQVSDISFTGLKGQAQRYAQQIMDLKAGEMTLPQLQNGYNKLKLNGDYLSILPDLRYDSTAQALRLNVHLKPPARFGLRFGATLFTPTDHQVQLGAKYLSSRFEGGILLTRGSFENSADGYGRLNLYGFAPVFLQGELGTATWDYQQKAVGVLPASSSAFASQSQYWFRGFVGLRMRPAGRLEVGMAYQGSEWEYYRTPTFLITDTSDATRLSGISIFSRFEYSTLNRKMYASKGRYLYASAAFTSGFEDFKPGDNSLPSTSSEQRWFQARLRIQRYFPTLKRLTFGFSIDAAYSNLREFSNPRASSLFSPRFTPFQDSPILLQDQYFSRFYIAPGMQFVLHLSRKLDFRAEGYWMQRFTPLDLSANSRLRFQLNFADKAIAATAGFAYHTPVGPIGLFLNYYEEQRVPVRPVLHIGYMIFTRNTWE